MGGLNRFAVILSIYTFLAGKKFIVFFTSTFFRARAQGRLRALLLRLMEAGRSTIPVLDHATSASTRHLDYRGRLAPRLFRNFPPFTLSSKA